jgi:hypothetical protein
MPQDEFRIFLSAVSSEFGKARDAVAADLRAREAVLRVQSDFRQEAGSDTTLKKLHDYICDCSAVVCIIGKRSGALPPPKAVEPFAHMLPNGITKASYTQWEFFFARHFKRRLSIYIATDDYQPDLAEPTGEDDPELQRAFRDHIVNEEGLDRTYFANEDQLARAILTEDWPKKPDPLNFLPITPLRTEQAVAGTKYDVFLSYSREDALWVESLAARLKAERGFSVWLDRWVLIPGRPWQREMTKGLKQARCCAVCINKATPEGWCREELERALSLQVDDEKYGVIPVLLPDALPDSVPDFLSLRTWADFRIGQDQNYAFHVLCQGIRGEPVGFRQQSSPKANEHSLSVYERRILELQRFRTLGVHEEVVIEFQRKILTEWFGSGE